MNKRYGGDVYIFQGANLAAPAGFFESPGNWAVPRTEAEAAFGKEALVPPAGSLMPAARPPMEYFEVPAIGGAEGLSYLALDAAFPLPKDWQTQSLRQAISRFDDDGAVGSLFRAYHIMQWRRDSVFCGSCGAQNADAEAELARCCPACGRLEFPRISPAIIVIITNNQDEALLAHNRKFSAGMYSLIAGFNEAGESLEHTVAREVREEVGITIRNVRYRASQPWPFPNSLMLGFSAGHAGGSIKPDGVEIEDARWFRRDNLPELPGKGSVSRYLINLWLKGAL
ncbi:MAG: NAD(+) diphosphatase [Treponema sp.]|jgi:NAD+ diphosphatase|nr:NAD(+) diphosphatase [Treponema sp.]